MCYRLEIKTTTAAPYFAENCGDHSNDEILSTFLVNFYNSANIPPIQIYVPDSIVDKEIIEQALYKVAQKPVKVLHAKNKKSVIYWNLFMITLSIA